MFELVTIMEEGREESTPTGYKIIDGDETIAVFPVPIKEEKKDGINIARKRASGYYNLLINLENSAQDVIERFIGGPFYGE